MNPNPASVFGKRRMAPEAEVLAVPVNVPEVSVVETPSDEAAMAAKAMDYTLGNPELPIVSYREQIVSAVDDSQATVITAETGAGKSTQVPQFLAEAGYEVIVTQPRMVAARSVAERVRDEIVEGKGPEYAAFVGHRTARERSDSPDNQILFVTDGLQLVRELSGNGAGKRQVLVLDEVHEWNENMEVLVAWAKKHMAEDSDFKVVVMSATMEAGPLAQYFADGGKREVPVIEVPGRTYEVKKEEGGDVADEAIKFAKEGKNTLVFVPGEAEIKQVTAEVERANIPNAVILPLYGRLEKEEQQKAFTKYPGAKVIVATNVAQTSITIEDIDVVVDSGLERQKRVKNGVEGLYLNPISRTDCLQRAGRAGRTKAGEYVLAQLGNNKLMPMAEREAYGTPEILRTRLDGMVLRLAKAGFEPSELEFYNVERQGEDVKRQFAIDIVKAKNRLQKLGALREDGSITKVGRDMERMPVESHYARMMIEARQYGPEVQMQLAAMLAVQEAGGICQFETKSKPCDERWRNLLAPDMNDSDAIKQLEVFVAAERMSDSQKRNHDIYVRAFSKSREVLRQLRSVEKLQDQNLSAPTKEQREQLVKCIIAGMVDNLYINDVYYGHRNAQGDVREVSSRAIIRPSKMVVGSPFDLQINTRRGLQTLNLLENPTNVPSIEVLREVAPQLFTEQSVGYAVDRDQHDGRVMEKREAVFNGMLTGEIVLREAIPSEQTRDYLIDTMLGYGYQLERVTALRDIARQLDALRPRTTEQLPQFTSSDIRQLLQGEVPVNVVSLEEAEQYVPEIDITYFLSQEKMDEIRANSPDAWEGMELSYVDGQPRLHYSVQNDEIMALEANAMVLPDGRVVRTYYGYDIAEYQARIVAERQAAAEREERQHAEKVQDALKYLRHGTVTLEYARGYWGERAANDANELYGVELADAAAEKERAEARRQAMVQQMDALLRDNEGIYSRTRLAGIDDDTTPDDIWDELDAVRRELDDARAELEREQNMLDWGHEVSIDAHVAKADELRTRAQAVAQRFMAWQQAEKEREKQPVSADALAALTAHFNKR